MYSLSLSSLATGPNIRVPLGFLSSLIITAAFSSNLIYEPSCLLTPLTERTITAFTTSPFFTTPPGVAFFTEAIITSPMLPNFLTEPPITRIHIISLAPVLSATFNLANGYAPSFYVSNDGTEWTKVGMEKEGSTYYRDCIGAENKYVKIVLSEVEGAHWQSELRTFSYNLVDPSGDGKVNAEDLVTVRQLLVGNEEGNAYDFNRDGNQDIKDLVALKKYLA